MREAPGQIDIEEVARPGRRGRTGTLVLELREDDQRAQALRRLYDRLGCGLSNGADKLSRRGLG